MSSNSEVSDLPSSGLPEPSFRCLHHPFEWHAARHPGFTAVEYAGGSWTYGELNQRANRIAAMLRSKGLGPDSIVGVCLDRRPELLAAIFGTLKVGAAFMPVDPALPGMRQKALAEDARPTVILTAGEFSDTFAGLSSESVLLDRDADPVTEWDDAGEDWAGSTNLAYLIYTSGSTGKPKGVMIEHRSVVNFVEWTQSAYPLTSADSVLLRTSIAFDASIWELFAPLTAGARLVLAPPGDQLDFVSLAECIRDHKVTHLQAVPSILRPLLEEPAFREAKSLRRILAGGEALAPDIVQRLQALGHPATLHNVYGPTEATVDATAWDVPRDFAGQEIPIGFPVRGTEVCIVDEALNRVPEGEEGELLIGGVGVARGYWNDPQATARSFIENPFDDIRSKRLYRTGDRVRRGQDGSLVYLGRLDDQVKVRGTRIEPAEVEAVLLKHPRVDECVVVARIIQKEEVLLDAYIAGSNLKERDIESIRSLVAEWLPMAMRPRDYMVIDGRLPRLASGKLDRKQLRDASTKARRPGLKQGATVPGTPTEKRLAAIWREQLGIEDIGLEDSFIELGGDSLGAMRLISEIRNVFGKRLNIREVFSGPTIRSLSRKIDAPDERDAAGHDEGPVPGSGGSGPRPLAPSQEQILLECLKNPELPLYNMEVAIRCGEAVDTGVLRASLNELVRRHEMLRAAFSWESGTLAQEVIPVAELALPVTDYRHLEESRRDTQALADANALARQVFDLRSPPLIRGLLGIMGDNDYRLYLVIHHMVGDAHSIFRILVPELEAIYRRRLEKGPFKPPVAELQYTDYTTWLQSVRGKGMLPRDLEYWEGQLAGLKPCEIPADRPRGQTVTYAGSIVTFRLPRELSESVTDTAAKLGKTPFVFLLSVFKVLLWRCTRDEEVVLGSVHSSRDEPVLENVFGCFLDYLVLRSRINSSQPFSAFLDSVEETVYGAMDHRGLNLPELRERLGLVPDPSRHPFYQVLFVLEPSRKMATGTWQASQLEFHSGTSKLDMTWEMDEDEEGLFGRVEYNSTLYETATVERLVERFRTLAEAVCLEPNRPVGQYPVMPEAERKTVLEVFNDTCRATATGKRLHDFLALQAARFPEKPAVVDEDGSFTFAQVDALSTRAAVALQRYGLEKEAVVAVVARRSRWLPVSLFSVLKAGGAYLPIDPDQPMERIEFLLKDSGAAAVIVDENISLDLMESPPVRTIHELVEAEKAGSLRDVAAPDSLAYVIYTSGSTGRPKGTMIEHRSILNRLLWMIEHFGLEPGDVHMQKTPITFDVSVPELFVWSITGATVLMPPPGAEKDPGVLIELVDRHKVTRIHFVPSMLEAFLGYLDAFGQKERLGSLKEVYCSGEALAGDLVEKFNRMLGEPLGIRLQNLYGPTEAAVEVSHYDASGHPPALPVPIGKPVWNTRLYILDATGEPVPIGVPGELFIGGIQVSRGYLNRPELNADVFRKNPFHPDGMDRMYRTGDQARWLPDGQVEYLGRNDFQVKIRGIRIELGEIEEAIRKVPGVTACVVVLKGKGSDNPQLVAYYCSSGPVKVDARAIRSSLRSGLPPMMVPELYVKLDTLPLTSSGKVDRRSLPEPERSAEHDTPVDEDAFDEGSLEGRMAEVWKGVVHTGGSVARGGFFEQGGNSLLAVLLVARLRQNLGISVPLGEFLRNPAFSTLVDIARREPASPGTVNGPAPRAGGDRLPLSWGQRRLWFLHQLDTDKTAHNIVLAVKIEGQLDHGALQEAARVLMKRHEALRTVFTVSRDEPEQVILPVEKIPEAPVAISEIHEHGHPGLVRGRIQDGYRHAFDLEKGPLFAPRLFRFKDGRHLIRIVLHHIIADEPSAGLVLKELFLEYNRILEPGKVQPVDEKPIQAGDVALWERSPERTAEAKKQLGWWQKELEGVPPVLRLPTDYRRPAETSFLGARTRMAVPPDIGRAFRDILRAEDATPFMGFLAAWAAFLGKIARQHDLVVGSPVSLRTFPGLENTVGFLVNTLPFRIGWEGEEGFHKLLRKVRKAALEAYRHRDLPFEQLVDSLKTERYAGIPPLFQVMLVMLGQEDPPPKIRDCRTELHTGESDASKFDLTLFVGEEDGSFNLTLEYRRDLFLPETMAAWLDGFVAMLGDIAERPQAPVDTIRAVAASDHDCQLERSYGSLLSADRHRTLPEWILAAIQSGPSAVAVEDATGTLAYGELGSASTAWAARIRRCLSSRNAAVGVLLPKSREWVTAMVAVMRAGAVYVPLDPAWPDERLRWIMEDAGLELVLVEPGEAVARLQALLEGGNALSGILVEPFNAVEAPGEMAGPVVVGDGPGPEDLAYMIYTSGSTGLPKGVEVEHRNAVASTLARSSVYGGSPTRFLLLSPPVFDSSIAGIFWTLCNGGTLVLPERGSERDPEVLTKQIQKNGISHYLTLPSMHQLLLSRLDPDLSFLDTVIVAGEACPLQLPARHRNRLKGVRLFNEYGPTEGSVWCSAEDITDFVDDGKPVPIGKPVPGYRLFVLDDSQQLLPGGAIGEIVIGGAGVVRGYRNRPEQTRERFLEAPAGLKEAGRLYRTGDLGRWRPDGSVDFLGRLDAQVKLRGHRVELGEVEAGLNALDGVGDSVALVREFHEGDYRLVAFVEPLEGSTPEPARLKRELAARLPAYALPSMILVERQLPRTATGKADRKALERMELDPPEAGDGLAGDHLTAALLNIWRNLIGSASITPDDDFFASGGDSFLAVRLFSEIERSLGVRLSIATLYRAPTIRSLVEIIHESKGGEDPNLPMVVPIRPGGDEPPLFFIHPRDGGILVYRELAQHLSGQRMVYGVEAPWRHADIVGDETIEAIAGHYLPGVLKNAGEGPIHLAGFSTGGLVALELAQQLRDRGREVGLVALLDTYNPANPPRREKAVKRWAAHVKMHGRGNIIQRTAGIVRLVVSTAYIKAGVAMEWLNAGRAGLVRRFRKDVPIHLRHFESRKTMLMANYRYRPRPYPGPLVLFRASQAELGYAETEDLGWHAVNHPQFRIVQAQGRHTNLMAGSHGKSLARQMDEAMQSTELKGC